MTSTTITTGLGTVTLPNPMPEQINVDDMLHGLSRIYRWNGAGQLTVLQHQIHVARLLFDQKADKITQLAGLVHDLHEYVTGDVPAPILSRLKFDDGECLWDMTTIQARIQRAIETRCGIDLTGADMDAVMAADILARDQEQGIGDIPVWLGRNIATLHPEQVIDLYRRGLAQLGVTL